MVAEIAGCDRKLNSGLIYGWMTVKYHIRIYKMQILTITKSAGHTSCPLNEFTLARCRIFHDEKITLLSFNNNDLSAVGSSRQYFEKSGTGNETLSKIVFQQAEGSIFKFRCLINDWLNKTYSLNNKSIIHIHQPGAGFLFSLLCRYKFRNIPVIYTVHNNYANYAFRHKLFMFFCFFISDKVTFVSRDSWDSFSDKFIRPSDNKSTIILNGVDVERIDYILDNMSKRAREDGDILKMITIGRCIPQKNQKLLVDALEQVKGNWTLDIYGEGNMSDSLQKEIDAKGLSDRIKLRGLVPRDDVFKALGEADVFVSPSLWEGLPVALMEAMCVALPCIVSNIPSHREVGEATEGVILTNLDAQEWQNRIKRLACMTPEDRIDLGRKNREIIEKHFSVRVMQKKYRGVYEELVCKK